MPSFVVIDSKKKTDFNSDAKTVLESHKFTEINPDTYTASSGASTVASKLKNLDSFKKFCSSAGIKIYHGNLSS